MNMDRFLKTHPAYSRVFQPGSLTFGFIAPLEGYPNSPAPTLTDHIELARQADRSGFSAIWLRDVPFLDPGFGDVGQIIDPFVYAGMLAAHTRQITVGTAGIVLTLRDPVLVAKQAASADQLLQGRFLLGLSTGDRPKEYPAFGQNFDNRAERFRDAHAVIRVLTEHDFPLHRSTHYGYLGGDLDLLPKPFGRRIPTLAVGRCRQDLKWIAENTDGWLWHQSDFHSLPEVISEWRKNCASEVFKPYGYAAFFDLDDNPDAPLKVGRGIRTGRKALLDLWERQREEGVSHVALNLKPLRRPAGEVMQELAEFVLPNFPSKGANNA
ncbi:LLM class oxidoreductase [Pseudomonas viridiflava]|uniref:LLM class oxidoreductase n=1 Tax=Pseudomonas viridiflava TaxID=33069 RepID=UPI0035283329